MGGSLGSDNCRLATGASISRVCLRVDRATLADDATSMGVARLEALVLEGMELVSRAKGACSLAISGTLGAADAATTGKSDGAAAASFAATGRTTSDFLVDAPTDTNTAITTAATAPDVTTSGRRDFLHWGMSWSMLVTAGISEPTVSTGAGAIAPTEWGV